MACKHKVYELKQVYATLHYLSAAIKSKYWGTHDGCHKVIMVMMRAEFAEQVLQTQVSEHN